MRSLHLLGVLNQQRGKPGEAHRLIASALKVDPKSPDALSNFAMALSALKRHGEALQSLDKALSVAPVPDVAGVLNSSFDPAKLLAKSRTTAPPFVSPPTL